MECLRCSQTMVLIQNRGVDIEYCENGCGGLWFDRHEFKKMDEHFELEDAVRERLKKSPKITVDVSEQLSCPHCVKYVMRPFMFKPGSRVIVDECPGCAGIWLDGTELFHIHEQFPTQADQQKAIQSLLDNDIEPILSEAKNTADEKTQRLERIGQMIRFWRKSPKSPS